MNRYALVIIGILFIIIIAAYMLSNKPERCDIRIGYNIDSINHSPMIIAFELGLFEKAGIVVKAYPSNSSKYTIQALSSGHIDIASSGCGHFFSAINAGFDIKLIAPCTFASTCIFVRPNELKSLKDLEGKKIASNLSSSSCYSLMQTFHQCNLDNKSLEIIQIDDAYRVPALMKHKIVDAAIAGSWNKKAFLESGAIILQQWEESNYCNHYYPRTSIGARTSFIDENPELMDVFFDVFIESQRFIKENPQEASEIIANYINENGEGAVKYESSDVDILMKDIKYFLWVDPKIFLDRANFEIANGALNAEFSLKDIFDCRYQNKLKKAQEEIYSRKQ